MTRVLATLQQESSVTFEVTTAGKLSKKDIDRFNILEEKLYRHDIEFTRKKNKTHARLLEEYIDNNPSKKSYPKNNIVGLVRDNGTIIGFVIAYTNDKFAHISSVYVDDNYRGKGYARTLLTNIFEDKLTEKVVSWKLNVAINNEAAKKLYKSLGFDVLIESMVMTV